jgi:hypothetical protein
MNTIISNNTDDPPRRGPSIMVPALWTAGENSGRPLTAEEQALLAVISTIVRFRRGERIYAEGDRADAVFNVITGVAKSYRTLPNGRQHIVGFLFADDLIGLAQNGSYVNSAEAVTAATLYRIPTPRFKPGFATIPTSMFRSFPNCAMSCARLSAMPSCSASNTPSPRSHCFFRCSKLIRPPAAKA